MATKTFTKTSKYVLPPWLDTLGLIDGIYVDGKFFGENVPILGASLKITAQPTVHLRTRTLAMSIAGYSLGEVSQKPLLINTWWPGTSGIAEETYDLSDVFYGVGLNILSVMLLVDLVTNVDVIFTVDYELKVSY